MIVTVPSALCARLSPRKLVAFIVLSDIGDGVIDVVLRVTEDKGVVDVNNDVRCLRGVDAVKEAVVEGRHEVTLGEECPFVVEIEEPAGVRKAI